MMERHTPSQVIEQRDARSSWSSTPKLWPTHSDNNTAQDDSVLDTAFVLIDAIPYPIPNRLRKRLLSIGMRLAEAGLLTIYVSLPNRVRTPVQPAEHELRLADPF
jgi:hypothetical protein